MPDAEEILGRAAAVIQNGGLVAFPTETVYGLGGNGLDPQAAKKIYAAKGRPSDNPLILHIAEMQEVFPLVREIPPAAKSLMEAFWPGPLTLILPKSDQVPYESTGGLDTVALRMPIHPVARELIRTAGVPLAAPSANSSGRPSPTQAAHVAEDLTGAIDMILDGGSVEIGLESTIVDVTGEDILILRPGKISLEEICRVVGEARLDVGVLNKPQKDAQPKAPGMKYRHYAPRAQMLLVEGKPENMAKEILQLATKAQQEGKKVAVLCTAENRECYGSLLCKTVGTRENEETIARNLFSCLREFDREDIDLILSETFREGAMGVAIMNRLMKAAGYCFSQPKEGETDAGIQ